MQSLKKISFIFSLLIVTSCYNSLDFDQIEDYISKPIYTAALTYLNVVPAKFFDSTGTVQQNSISDVSEFGGFDNYIVRNNVVKMVFNAEFKNEFDRDVTFKVAFLNDNDNVTYAFTPIFVESNDLNPPPFEEEVIINSNSIILTTTQVKITAELEDTGTQMNPLDISEFELKSSVTFYLESEF